MTAGAMDHFDLPPPVIVGIDGSKAAIAAAIWAIDEAVSRDAPLRLVHVMEADVASRDRGHAAAARLLYKAWCAIESMDRPVVVDSELLQGDPAAELVEASRTAGLICLGVQTTSPRFRSESIAVEVARRAHSPVAIVRSAERQRTIGDRWRQGTWSSRVRDLRPFHDRGRCGTVVLWSI